MDKLLREGFENLVLQAEAGLLTSSWSKRPRSLVALILLLDQFSRSAFRLFGPMVYLDGGMFLPHTLVVRNRLPYFRQGPDSKLSPRLMSPHNALTRRHIFRGRADRDERVGACDRRALPLAESLLAKGWQQKLTVEQHVFALMPLRHTPRLVSLATPPPPPSPTHTHVAVGCT